MPVTKVPKKLSPSILSHLPTFLAIPGLASPYSFLVESLKNAAARRQKTTEPARSSDGAHDAAPVLREFLRTSHMQQFSKNSTHRPPSFPSLNSFRHELHLRSSKIGGFCRDRLLIFIGGTKSSFFHSAARGKNSVTPGLHIPRNPSPLPRVLVRQGVRLIMRSLLSASVSFLLCSSAALPADLPVKQVTLYKHGIGYFERAGSVPGGEEVRLDFKNTDMNDVLKSLIVFDANGGKISGIRYDSNATLEQQLEKYPFTIGNQEMLSTFLDRLKGAHLEITCGRR